MGVECLFIHSFIHSKFKKCSKENWSNFLKSFISLLVILSYYHTWYSVRVRNTIVVLNIRKGTWKRLNFRQIPSNTTVSYFCFYCNLQQCSWIIYIINPFQAVRMYFNSNWIQLLIFCVNVSYYWIPDNCRNNADTIYTCKVQW